MNIKPHWENLKYLSKHKWYVFRAGLKLNVSILRLILHDWSKLTPIEWTAYAAYFFGKKVSDHNMHVPGKRPGIASQPMTDTEGVLGTVQNPDGELMDVVKDDEDDLKEWIETKDAKLAPSPPGAPETVDIINETDRVAQQFDRAWLHHQHLNPHHFQHWILNQNDGEVTCLEMPRHFALEMCSDWIGAGKAQGKTDRDAVLVWYESNRENIKLHPATRKFVEATLTYYVECRN